MVLVQSNYCIKLHSFPKFQRSYHFSICNRRSCQQIVNSSEDAHPEDTISTIGYQRMQKDDYAMDSPQTSLGTECKIERMDLT